MNIKRTRAVGVLLLLAAVFLLVAGCGSRNNQNETGGASSPAATATASPSPSASASESAAPSFDPSSDNDPVVTIEMDSGDKIVIELYPKVAPITVNNFISLAKQGFYDGTIFHRVIPGFMIQGGDPEGTGAGGPGYTIKGEFAANNVDNQLLHTRGVLSMARRGDSNDSAGSQFFIMVAETYPSLDGQYATFGKVVSGMEAVDKIVALPTEEQDRPVDPPVMKKVTVDTKGVDYPEPEKIAE
ncbi:peptidyl-prolyl cis-trans isomerase B (cyclophilin B) [Cohnella sp. OV330]|uniref:peptidylprolyl isomerase n=1 Tax=Cohnella sp. OV330 TaxID=1855288 RepID=UPI0008EF5415|nr:peptidylprolyl isomerase [Cohnella sp. OV330]SFB60721.1 peptidyl-prolyl cis-trans isomerase B (cyclophilin B) [Cohnella sp. OV330]